MNIPDDKHSLIDNRVTSLFFDTEGVFWVGTWGDGLHRYDSGNDRFIRFDNDQSQSSTLRTPKRTQAEVNSSAIMSSVGLGMKFIHEDQTGILWFGAMHGGVTRYDREKDESVHYEYDFFKEEGFSSDAVWSIYESRDGAIWIGTTDRGVLKITPRPFQANREIVYGPEDLRGKEITAVLEDKEGKIWIGTTSGLYVWDLNNTTFSFYTNEPDNPSSISHNNITSIVEQDRGVLWVGTYGGGLNRFDNGIFTSFRHNSNVASSLSSDFILSLHLGQHGVLWIGTEP